jgi:hypothetical protein
VVALLPDRRGPARTAAACLLLAYARRSSGRLCAGMRYHLFDLAGGGLAVDGAFRHAWPSTLLNLVWLGIGLAARYRVRTIRHHHRPARTSDQCAPNRARSPMPQPHTAGRVNDLTR